MCFAPVNPADLLAVDGRYAFTLYDTVPVGAEAVGIVDQIGDAVTDLNLGDSVLPLTRGNWCRYRTVPRGAIIWSRMPPVEATMRDTARAAMFVAIFALHKASPIPLPVRAILPLSQGENAVALARTSGRGRVLLDLAG